MSYWWSLGRSCRLDLLPVMNSVEGVYYFLMSLLDLTIGSKDCL